MPIKVLFEDQHLIIAEKPANVLIHNSYYARNIKEKTLLNRLKQELGFPLYPVHRLDRKTSGLILLAKKKEDVSIFQSLFSENQIKKRYIAIVRGFLTEEVRVDSPVKHPETGIYKSAVTFCESICEKQLDIPVHPYESSRYSLVSLKPTTGRIHQLRIHMNKISHPILGDAKYGDRFHNRMFEAEFQCTHLLLHSLSLEFIHPVFKNQIFVQSKQLPRHWQHIISQFDWEKTIRTVFKI